MKECHSRAAARIAQGSIENGGLYVKMGQGLVTADHIVPREYIDGLRVLLDRALRRQRNEVDSIVFPLPTNVELLNFSSFRSVY